MSVRKKKDVYQLDQKIGAVVKEGSETLICALEKGIYRFNQNDGSNEFLNAPEPDKPENIFNDGKCDQYGRFWVGTMSIHEEKHAGNLYCFTSDNQCEMKHKDVTISNGIAWTEDGKTMYYIDSATYKIVAFDYDIENGSISNKRTAFEFRLDQGIPDGMTIDRDGNLWVAMWGGSCVLHCDPVRGKILNKIELPVSNVTSCTFGGKNLDVLYITTAKAELNKEEKQQQPLAADCPKTQYFQ